MLEKIQALLAEALNLPLEKVTPDAKIVEDLGADFGFGGASQPARRRLRYYHSR